MTDGKTHEVNVINQFDFSEGNIAVFDRVYIDFDWMNDLDSKGILFVTRAKSNMVYTVKTCYVDNPDADGVRVYADIQLWVEKSKKAHPKALRLIRYWDAENQRNSSFDQQ